MQRTRLLGPLSESNWQGDFSVSDLGVTGRSRAAAISVSRRQPGGRER